MRKLLRNLILLSILCSGQLAWALPAYLAPLCQDAKFTCIKVHTGTTWTSLFADAQLRDLIMRLNRMDIQPRPGQILVMPNNMATVNLLELSPFPATIVPTDRKTVIFNPALGAWAAYNAAGQLIKWGPASGGRDQCIDSAERCRTVVGDFNFYRKGGSQCASSKFPLPNGGAPIPYCAFFYKGTAIHAGILPGYNSSHGCVHVFFDDAQWLNREFISLNPAQATRMIVEAYPDNAAPLSVSA